MPDASGNFKGISLSGIELPWERNRAFGSDLGQRVHAEDRPQNPNEDAPTLRSKLDVSSGAGAKAMENSQVGEAPNPNLKAWQEAQRTAAFKWAGTD
jgi:hypothetical protein